MRCAVFLANGFEESEAVVPADLLRRGGMDVDLLSMEKETVVEASHGMKIVCDHLFSLVDPDSYDVFVVPGGKKGTAALHNNEVFKEALARHYMAGKLTCMICAAPSILGEMGYLKGKHFTCYPDFYKDFFGGTYEEVSAIRDGNLVTGKGMGASCDFGLTILRALLPEDAVKEIEEGIQYGYPVMK